MNRGAWRAVVHGVTKESDVTEQLTLSEVWRCNFPLRLEVVALFDVYNYLSFSLWPINPRPYAA